MSRDSRLVHSKLHALTEHLAEHNARVAAAAELAHTQLTERRQAPARDTHKPVAVELPAGEVPPRSIEPQPEGGA